MDDPRPAGTPTTEEVDKWLRVAVQDLVAWSPTMEHRIKRMDRRVNRMVGEAEERADRLEAIVKRLLMEMAHMRTEIARVKAAQGAFSPPMRAQAEETEEEEEEEDTETEGEEAEGEEEVAPHEQPQA